ncbi:hypothetical protein OKW11_005978 [Pseudomonas baetica]|nr:hypothetical protein [Pseudomonas baetica]
MNGKFETDEQLLRSLGQEPEFGPAKLQRRANLSYNRAAYKIEEWLKAGKIRSAEGSPYRFVVCADREPGAVEGCQSSTPGRLEAGEEAQL